MGPHEAPENSRLEWRGAQTKTKTEAGPRKEATLSLGSGAAWEGAGAKPGLVETEANTILRASP